MKTNDFFKTLTILVVSILIVAGIGYVLYSTFREKPLDLPAPYIKDEQDAGLNLVDEQKDELFGDASIQAQIGDPLPNCDATPDTQQAQDMLTRVNAYRAQNGVGPLKLSPTLMRAAAWFADDLLARNERGHIDALGRDPSQRALDCGYPVQTVAENTAGGTFSDPLTGWQGSPEHNDNLLRSNMVVMGYGIAQSGGIYRFVWIAGTQDDSGTGEIPPTPTLTPSPTNSQQTNPTNTPTPTTQPGTTTTPTPTGTVYPPTTTGCIESPTHAEDKCGGYENGVWHNGYRYVTSTEILPTCYTTIDDCLPNEGQGSCVRAPVSPNDTCTGYKVMPGLGRACYNLKDCQVAAGITPSPTSSQNPTPTLSPNTKAFELSFEFPGIGAGGNTSLVYDTKDISLQIFDDNNNLVKEEDIKPLYTQGKYTTDYIIPQDLNGIYYTKAKGKNTLSANSQPEVVTINSQTRYPLSFSLVPGDLNDDNLLDIRDYNLFLTKFLVCYVVPNCGEEKLIDFDADGKVDIVDFNILLRSFAEIQGV